MKTKILIANFIMITSLSAWAETLPAIQGKLKGGEQQTLTIQPFKSDYAIIDINVSHVNLSHQGVSVSLCRQSKNVQTQDCQLLQKDITQHVKKHLRVLPKQAYQLHIEMPKEQQQTVDYQITIEMVPTKEPNTKPLVNAKPTSALLRKVRDDIQAAKNNEAKQQIIENFWQRIKNLGTPLIEPLDEKNVRMTFLWRGAKHNVRLFGGPANDHIWLAKLPDSDIWFHSFDVPNDTRLSYQFAPDIPTVAIDPTDKNSKRKQRVALLSTLTTDPLNPNIFPQKMLQHTEAVESDSMIDLYTDSSTSYRKLLAYNISHEPDVQLIPYPSNDAQLARRVWFYRPPVSVSHKKPIVLYFFDGDEYAHRVGIPTLLDRLIEQKILPPLYAVFIDNPTRQARMQQLPGNDEFASFIANQFVPWSNQILGITTQTDKVLIGSSYGGLASAYIAGKYPDIFHYAIPLSGSFWWHPDGKEENAVADFYASTPQKPIQFFLAAGRFETSRKNELSIIDTSRQLAKALQAKNYDVTFKIYSSGHDYLMWQQAVVEGLVDMFGEK